MTAEKPLAWERNWRCQALLFRLEKGGPQSTIQLQKALPLVHVARQVWELRHWYGVKVKTTRLPNRVAVYEVER